jgi:hypothetical protein
MSNDPIQNMVEGALHRRQCPEPFALGEFDLTLLKPAEMTRIQEHVQQCLACQADLAALREFSGDYEPAAIWSTVRAWTVGVVKRASQTIDAQTDRIAQVTLRPLPGLVFSQVHAGGVVRGPAASTETRPLLHYLNLDASDLNDMAVEVKVFATAQSALCDVVLFIDIPSRWPDLAAVQVSAVAGAWTKSATTSANGALTLSGLPISALENLSITITVPEPR